MYKIEIDYSTGNTFGSHDETRIIDDVEFADIESAKQALQIINKHHKMCSELSSYGMKDADRKALLLQIEHEPWAVKSEWSNNFEFEIKVPTSVGCQEWENVYCFWMGYFEHIQEARIVDANSEKNELSISFR